MARLTPSRGIKDARMWAFLDPTRKYRYSLGRMVSDLDGTVCFILLNPSTADSEYDDATVRRCIGFCQDWGFGNLQIVNLFSLRATSPKKLPRARNPVGKLGDSSITAACKTSHRIVAGWGNHGGLQARSSEVLKLLFPFREKLFCFGLTSLGEPRHPLYLKKTALLIPFGRLPL